MFGSPLIQRAVVPQGLELLKARTDAESMEMGVLKLMFDERQGLLSRQTR
jgi:hypothetical protein